MIEGTAPLCVFQTFARPTSPPACSVRQSGSWSIQYVLQTEQGEGGWANVWKTQGGALPSITDIYSLIGTVVLRNPLKVQTMYNCTFYVPERSIMHLTVPS